MTDTVCANGRDGRVLAARKALRDGGEQTTVAAGHGSGADVYDSGVGSAKPETCKAWRNSGQVKLYLGGTASKASWRALPDCWPLMTGRPAASLHKAADSPHCTEAESERCRSRSTDGVRACTFRPRILPTFYRRKERTAWSPELAEETTPGAGRVS